MKKPISLILAATVALSLCACGEKKTESSKAASQSESSKAASQTEAATETTAATPPTEAVTVPAGFSYVGTWVGVKFPEIDYYELVQAELGATIEFKADKTFVMTDTVTINKSKESETMTGTYTADGAKVTLNGEHATVTQNNETKTVDQKVTLQAALQNDGKLAVTTTDNQQIIFEKKG